MSKHVDDLKIACEPEVVQSIIAEIQKVFGEMKVNKYDFTNCGVRHIQDPNTFAITLDQIHLANTLQIVSHPQLSTGKNDDLADSTLHELYR